MAATELVIYTVPFQGDIDLTTNLTTPTADCVFVNDGYTVMMVINADAMNDCTVTINGVPDNSGRDKTLTQVIAASGGRFLFGPFRPIWWNLAGQVQASFSMEMDGALDDVSVKVIKFQF